MVDLFLKAVVYTKKVFIFIFILMSFQTSTVVGHKNLHFLIKLLLLSFKMKKTSVLKTGVMAADNSVLPSQK